MFFLIIWGHEAKLGMSQWANELPQQPTHKTHNQFLFDLSRHQSVVDPQCCSVQFNDVWCCFVLWWNSDVTIWLLLISLNGPLFWLYAAVQYTTICCKKSKTLHWWHGRHRFHPSVPHDGYGKCWIHATVHLYAMSICGYILTHFGDRLPQHGLLFCWRLIKYPISSCCIITVVNLFIKGSSDRNNITAVVITIER